MMTAKEWDKLSESEKRERWVQCGRDAWLAGIERDKNPVKGNIAFLDWDQGWGEACDEYNGGKHGAESPKVQ